MVKKKKKVKTKPSIFTSYDHSEDKEIKQLFTGQAKNEKVPFSFKDSSLKEAALEKEWEKKAEAKIKKSDAVVVLVGEKTHSAQGVKKEVEFARKHNIPVFQVHNGKNLKRVDNAGRKCSWKWEKIKNLLEKNTK